MQLPDGALKRQLLGEIADLVQLAARELTELWTPKTASGKSGKAKSYSIDSNNTNEFKVYKPFSSIKSPQPPRWGGRALPASRADHAVRLLMGNMAGLAALTAEEHAMLCELPAPHGALFVWLEGQLQEHGKQPWVALREGLRGHDLEELGIRLMGNHELDAPQPAEESTQELRQLLDRMLVERLKAQETEAIEDARRDPNALVRYREIQVRRRQLELAGDRVDAAVQTP
jgi:DNA primase